MVLMCDAYFSYRKTVVQMLKDRGYDVVREEILFIDKFRSRFGQLPNPINLGFRVSHLSDPSDTLQVVFANLGDLKLTNVRNIYKSQIGDKASLKRLILIVSSKVAKNAEKEIEGWNYKYEIMRVSDLNQYATMNDWKWNQYYTLTSAQKAAVLSKYNSEGTELSSMPKTDRIACYYGMEKGQVISIIDARVIVAREPDDTSYRRIV